MSTQKICGVIFRRSVSHREQVLDGAVRIVETGSQCRHHSVSLVSHQHDLRHHVLVGLTRHCTHKTHANSLHPRHYYWIHKLTWRMCEYANLPSAAVASSNMFAFGKELQTGEKNKKTISLICNYGHRWHSEISFCLFILHTSAIDLFSATESDTRPIQQQHSHLINSNWVYRWTHICLGVCTCVLEMQQ